VITEKGLGAKEAENTLVFEVAPNATKTEVKEAVEALFKVKVDAVRTATFAGKERRRGKFAGFRPDWKKAYVKAKGRREAAGVREQSVKTGVRVSKCPAWRCSQLEISGP
jgi:large subunit ribosomal protein L23